MSLNTILGTKVKMSQIFLEGMRIPVTIVKTGPQVVTFIKKEDKDGYNAVQLGLGSKRIKNVSKPLQGHLKASIQDKKAPRYLQEVRVEETPEYEAGSSITASDVLTRGDIVDVTGISKGKGFAGGVKRWKFAGGPKTHGQSDRWRAPGSIGPGTTIGHVLKGKHMAGRMGGGQVTVQNVTVLRIDPKRDEVFISGSVPGPFGTLVRIKKTGETKKLAEDLEFNKQNEPEVVEEQTTENVAQ